MGLKQKQTFPVKKPFHVCMSKISINYNCNVQVIPFNGVKHTSCNRREISSSDNNEMYVCFSDFTLVCCSDRLHLFSLIVQKVSTTSFVQA